MSCGFEEEMGEERKTAWVRLVHRDAWRARKESGARKWSSLWKTSNRDIWLTLLLTALRPLFMEWYWLTRDFYAKESSFSQCGQVRAGALPSINPDPSPTAVTGWVIKASQIGLEKLFSDTPGLLSSSLLPLERPVSHKQMTISMEICQRRESSALCLWILVCPL